MRGTTEIGGVTAIEGVGVAEGLALVLGRGDADGLGDADGVAEGWEALATAIVTVEASCCTVPLPGVDPTTVPGAIEVLGC